MPDHYALTKPSFADRPSHVLFFAAVSPPEIKSQMAKAWQAFGTGETFRLETLHLSIYAVAGVDDLDPILVKRARQAANVLRTAPFTLCFDRLTTFNSPDANYPLVLETERISDKLNDVAAELHAACRAMGITASRSANVTPHVTVAYGTGFSETRRIDTAILWKIDEVTLIDSLQGRGRHVPLGLWPLPHDRQQLGFDF